MAQQKTEQVLVRVTPERKEAWEQAADECGYGVSEFVRHAVDDRIEGRGVGRMADVDSEAIADAVEERITDETEEIQRKLASIETALSGIHDELETGGEGTVAAELIFETLPTVDIQTVNEEGKVVRRDPDEMISDAKSAEQIAADIGVPVDPVRRTLERLAVESERVGTVEQENGEMRYYADV